MTLLKVSISSKHMLGHEEKFADEGVVDLCLVSENGPSKKLGLPLYMAGHVPCLPTSGTGLDICFSLRVTP